MFCKLLKDTVTVIQLKILLYILEIIDHDIID